MEYSIVPAFNTSEVETRIELAKAKAEEISIANDQEYEATAKFVVVLASVEKEIKAMFAGPKKEAHEAHKIISSAEKERLAPVNAARQVVSKKMTAYTQEKEKARREEERRLQAEATRLAEEERLKEAEDAADAGDMDEADRLLEKPVIVAPVITRDDTPKIEGISYRTSWKFRIKNPELVPEKYKTIDEKKIGGIVRAMKGETDIPGIEVYSERSVAARG